MIADPASGLLIPNVRDGQQPSGELWMHWNLQRDTKKTRTVVHVHATHVVAAMYAGIDLQAMSAELPETTHYTRVGPTVPALPALSRDLADVTTECLRIRNDGSLEFDIVGQANHSVCAVATDLLGRL